jgi:hypothetical protein
MLARLADGYELEKYEPNGFIAQRDFPLSHHYRAVLAWSP